MDLVTVVILINHNLKIKLPHRRKQQQNPNLKLSEYILLQLALEPTIRNYNHKKQ